MTDGSLLASRPFLTAPQRRTWIGPLVALAIAGALVLCGAVKLAAIMVVGIAGMTMLTHPLLAVYAFAFLLYTNAPVVASRFHGVPGAVGVGVAGLLLIPLFHQIVVLRKPLIISPALPFILLFAAFRVLAIIWSEEKDLAIRSVVTTITEGLLLYSLLTNVIRTRHQLQGVVYTILIAASVLGALSIFQQATGNLDGFGGFAQTSLDDKIIELDAPDKDARSAGPIGEKNYYAQFMLFLLPLGFMWVRTTSSPLLRCLSILTVLLILMGVATAASRGAAVGFVVMVLVMLAMRELQVRHVAMILVCSFTVVLVVPAYQQRLHAMISAVGVLPGSAHVQSIEKSLQGRISEMWAAALVFSEHPIGGVGPGNFPPQFLKKAGSLGFQIHAEQRMAHCSYLEIAAETGLIGLLLYLGILGITLRELWKARQRTLGTNRRLEPTSFILVVVVMMTTGLFLSFAFERYYWFMLALAAVSAETAVDSGEDRSCVVQPSSDEVSS